MHDVDSNTNMADKEKIENLEQQVSDLNVELGTHTVVTKTPLHDFSWYVKWISAGLGVTGAMFTAAAITPWNVILGFISMVGWGYVGVLWNDRAMIVMNIFLAGAYLQSLMPALKTFITSIGG